MNKFFRKIFVVASFFVLFASVLNAFAADDGKSNAKRFYVLIPNDREWKSSVPMYSTDGTFAGGKPLSLAQGKCGWYYAEWVGEKPPKKLILFMDTDSTLQGAIGAEGWNADELVPMDMETLFLLYGTDNLYFVSDVDLWDEEGEQNMGLYDHDPGVADPGLCSYVQAALIYDTDATLHGAFTCDTTVGVGANGCYSAVAKYNYPGDGAVNTVPCIGVTPGIVQKSLPHGDKTDSHYKKPVYNTSSGCFVSEDAFDVMFRETEGVNSFHCRDMKFTLTNGGLWEYDSFNETTEAYVPLNDLADSVKLGTCTGTCAEAATLHVGFGSVSYGEGTAATISTVAEQALGSVANWGEKNTATGIPYIFSYPVSKGEFDSGTHPDVYDNSTWETRSKGDNNQMFCLESHSKFRYRKGLEFYFRAADDMWVFIDNTLAVDLGGLHLAAPATVNLDQFMGENGTLVVGEWYDIDIFHCNRRSDMSSIYIKTNMFVMQTSGLEFFPRQNNDKIKYELCYTESGDASCASWRAGGYETSMWCGDDFPKPLYYKIETDDGVTVAQNLASGYPTCVYYGGIDLRHGAEPTIDLDKISGLEPGRYNLMLEEYFYITDSLKIPFEVAGDQKVVGRTFATPDFSVEISGSRSFDIVGGPSFESRMRYVVMDLMGSVVKSGMTDVGKTSVFVKNAGTYIVRVGLGSRLVKVK